MIKAKKMATELQYAWSSTGYAQRIPLTQPVKIMSAQGYAKAKKVSAQDTRSFEVYYEPRNGIFSGILPSVPVQAKNEAQAILSVLAMGKKAVSAKLRERR